MFFLFVSKRILICQFGTLSKRFDALHFSSEHAMYCMYELNPQYVEIRLSALSYYLRNHMWIQLLSFSDQRSFSKEKSCHFVIFVITLFLTMANNSLSVVVPRYYCTTM